MEPRLRLLIIEDSEDDALLLVRELRQGGVTPDFERVETAEEMRAALREKTWDLVVSDYVLPGFSGIDALSLLKESGIDLPFIIVSGQIGEDAAVAAMKAGAHDYMIKGSLKRLVPAIERELRETVVRREKRLAEGELRRAKAELEIRVRERTSELMEIRDELELEVLERRRNEAALDRALKEKETLLRELYHRTKNNMNVISSLISLQAASLSDKEVVQMFSDLQNRIRSMALVHQKLYQSGDLSNVSLREYISDLAHTLLGSYKTGTGRIGLRLDGESFSLSVDTLIPCGLIINELMSNSLKYAFPDDTTGEIRISCAVTEDEQIRIRYSDTGPGLPAGFDIRSSQTLGMKLLRRLTEGQLGGELELKIGEGTEFVMTFREPNNIG
ncbi:MAG: response regulator [Nitrospirales bacterium]|nr:response regulator [Nitrospirales bacterium]